MTDEELKKLVASLTKDRIEFRNEIQKVQKETSDQMKETDRRMDKRMKETDKQIKEMSKEMDKLRDSQRESFKELRDSNKELRDSFKELRDSHKELGKMVGGISNNQGDVAEEFFFNSLSAKPEVANITYDFVDKNITRTKGLLQDEFDLVMINGTDVLVIETKYKAHENDLARLLNKKFPNFKQLYPQYKNYRHHLGLASFHINDTLKEQALNKNVIVLQRKGKVIETSIPRKK